MKPSQIKAGEERRAKVKLRRLARKIPDNARLINILLQFEPPFRVHFYAKVQPYLKFKPVPLEEINGLRSQ